ncbi:hypothetical protein PRIC2_011422 [Phytophthora ramorum]
MRPNFLVLLVVATFALSCIDLASANGVQVAKVEDNNTPRYLKGSQTSTEEEELDAEDEDRGFKDVVAKAQAAAAAGTLNNQASKWKGLAEKMKSGQLAQLDDKIAATSKWKSLSEKLKAGQLKNLDDEVATTSRWKTLADKLQSGQLKNVDDEAASISKWKGLSDKFKAGELKNLDTKQSRWKNAFSRLKSSGQIKNVDEAQIAKVTEGIAKEVAKQPGKWSYFGKAMKILFGVGLTVLIVIGIQGMMGS